MARRRDLTIVAHFLTGHYHLGDWTPTRDPDEYELCPLCGDLYSREHLIFECEPLDHVRRDILGSVLGRCSGGLAGLARLACAPMGRFLLIVRDEVSRCLDESTAQGEDMG